MDTQTDAARAGAVMTANAAMAGCPVHWVATIAGAEPAPEPVRAPAWAGRPNLDEVRDFYAQYRAYTDMPEDAYLQRVAEVEAEIDARGTYTHTTDELTVGAKLAWYNHTRCIGKLYWRSLEVRDFRHATSAEDIRDACFDHVDWVANGGRVRPAITIFAPDAPGAPAPRIRNAQIVAYAGYRGEDGTLIGDGGTVELTELALASGWTPPATRGPFDLLPLIIETGDGHVTTHEVTTELAREVEIEHPTIPGLAALGLRWYGFPNISDMGMSIGGIFYPTSPFTGWYVAPELSARDFTDSYRYNMLPEIAVALGLDISDRRSLWKDRAMVELTTAVLHSFDRAGMRIDDHHTASEKFHKWSLAEKRRGRTVDAEWQWMIPPISASATPVFHETYTTEQKLPNFLREVKPSAPAGGCPFGHKAEPARRLESASA